MYCTTGVYENTVTLLFKRHASLYKGMTEINWMAQKSVNRAFNQSSFKTKLFIPVETDLYSFSGKDDTFKLISA